MPDISLIPKDYKEKKGGFKTIFSKIEILIIILIVFSLLVYGGLLFYSKSLNSQFYSLQKRAEEISKERNKEFENEAVSLAKTLKNLEVILKDHLYWSNLFSKLGELTVPQISFTDFKGDLAKDGSANLVLNGKTTGYTYLARQMASFSQEKLISDVKISGITLGTEGGIEFGLNINFLKEILLK